jgi:Zn-dependent protease
VSQRLAVAGRACSWNRRRQVGLLWRVPGAVSEGEETMKWSQKLITIRGIEIKVHITFLLVLVWGAMAWGSGGWSGAIYGSFLTLAVFAFVLLHELGHAIAAQRYGIPVRDILLLPIGGLARLTRMPEKPSQELLIALAGPAVNLALILVLLPFVGAGLAMQAVQEGELHIPSTMTPGLLNLATFLLMTNVMLLLFNMLPAFPLDGGRVLRALLSMRLSGATATRLATAIGKLFALLFGMVALLSGNVSLAMIAFFVFLGAGAEGQEAAAREMLRGVTVAEAVDAAAPTLPADAPAHLAFDRLARSPYRALAVLDEGGAFLGIVTRAGMQRQWAAGVRGAVCAFAEQPSLVMRGEATLDAARRDMVEAGTSIAAVFIQGCFAGLLDLEAIHRALTTRRSGLSPEKAPLSG